MKVYSVYRKGPEWTELIGIYASKKLANNVALARDKKTASAKTSKERQSVYVVRTHKVIGAALFKPSKKLLIGQRVLLNDSEIGIVCEPERKDLPNTDTEVWVFSPRTNYASRYSVHNVKPLPGGQL